MRKAFVLILSYVLLFLNFNIVNTQNYKDDPTNIHVKLTKKNEDSSKEKKLIKNSLLQLNTSKNSIPCKGDYCFCHNYYDLTLIIDESRNVGKERWVNEVVPFVEETVKLLDVSEDEIHVGIMLFSKDLRDFVNFGKKLRFKKKDLLKKIKQLNSLYANGPDTLIVKALYHAFNTYTKHPKSRSSAPKVTILFTAGHDPSGNNELHKVGLFYKNENVKLLVLGVGGAVLSELSTIAGCDAVATCPFAMKVEWQHLKNASVIMVDKICNSKGPETSTHPEQPPTCKGDDCFCQDYYDLTLIIDESGSIGKSRWVKEVVPFTSKVVEHLQISETKVHVGILLFAVKIRDYVTFSEKVKYQKHDLIQRVNKLKNNYIAGGGTYIVDTLQYALQNYTWNKNSRRNAPKVTILFTDGNDTKHNDLKVLRKVGSSYRENHVKLLVLGVGKAVIRKLNALAGCYEGQDCPFAMKAEWENLGEISKMFTDKICTSGPVIPNPEPTPEGEIGKPEIVEPEKPEVVEPEKPEVVEPEKPEVVEPEKPGAVEPEKPEAVEPEKPEAVEPEKPGAIEPEKPEGETGKPEVVPEQPKPCIGDDCFCKDYYDLTLILDDSGSIGTKNWKSTVVPFTEKLVEVLEISKDKIHVGIMLFALYMKDLVRFSDAHSYDKNSLLKITKDLANQYKPGNRTYIVEALHYAFMYYTRDISSRPDVSKVTMLFTDGNDSIKSNDELYQMGLFYRKEHVKLLVVGVAVANKGKLNLIAGCKQNENCPFSIKANWEDLVGIAEQMGKQICDTGSIPEPETEPGKPEGETGKPEGETGKPEGETGKPEGETGKPEGETGKPEGETGKPEGETGKPEGETGKPEGETGKPEGETGKPEGETGKPEGETGKPEGETGKPEGETGKPEGETGKPEGETGKPEGETGKPEGETGKPEGETGKPEGETGKPEGETGKPEGETGTGPKPEPCKGDNCFCHNFYDLTLVIDESASIGEKNWKKQVVPFTEEVVRNLEVSIDEIHLGIMLFAKNMRDYVKFSDIESYDKEKLIEKTKKLKDNYARGSHTYIVESLEYALANYTKDKNSRKDAPKVTMLFTDGNNSNPNKNVLSNVSLLYKKENVKLLVIGVGVADIQKLRLLGGCDEKESDCPFVMKTNWDDLKNASEAMIDKICNTESIDKPKPEEPCNGDACLCKDYFDLTFIIAPEEYEDNGRNKYIHSASTAALNTFNINEEHTHVSLVIYLGEKTIKTSFSDAISYNQKELIKATNKLYNIYMLRKINITHALEIGLEQSFGNGNREKAPKVVLLLTNSNSGVYEKERLNIMARKYVEKQIKILIIGLGRLPKESLFIAGGCNLSDECPNVFLTTNFDYYNRIESFLERNICESNNIKPQTPPTFSCNDPLCEECDDDLCNNNTICKKALDIAIVLDQSRNISTDKWNKYIKPFAVNIVKQNYLSKYMTHITLVKMKKHAKAKWDLNKKKSYKKNKIIKEINKLLISHTNNKNISNTFKYLRMKVFTKTPKNKKKVIIMLVEGKSNTNLNELRKEIELLKINKIDFFIYAIDNIDENEYRILGDCESPNSLCKNIFKVSYENLLNSSESYMRYICNYYPEDAHCSEWGEWSPCPETCNRTVSKRERKGPYTLKGEGFKNFQYGSSCMDLGSIEYRKCPIKEGCEDICGDFGEWSQCSATCGDGIRIRHRDQTLDNEICKLYDATQIEPCNIQDCNSNENCEEIGEWSEWSSCSKTCGYSIKKRIFTILPEYIDKYPNCKNEGNIDISVCSVPKCEDENCFEWSEWNEWSATCGPRRRAQKAHLHNNVVMSFGNNKRSDSCEEKYQDKIEYDKGIPCSSTTCGEWTDWSECDRTCNAGVRIRQFISNYQGFGFNETEDDINDECLERLNDIETEACLDLPPCDSGECNDWETWVNCEEKNCHKPNKKILTRSKDLLKTKKDSTSEFCEDYGLFREEECPESNKPCNDALCNEWEEWESCSATCGTSFKIRKRKEPLELIAPSEDINGNMGLSCEQQNINIEEKELCDVPVCATGTDGNGGNGSKEDSNKKTGFGTGEKVSLAAGVIGLIALATGGLIYGYNTFNGGEIPDNSNMEFENVENNIDDIDQANENFEVIDANDPMWN